MYVQRHVISYVWVCSYMHKLMVVFVHCKQQSSNFLYSSVKTATAGTCKYCAAVTVTVYSIVYALMKADIQQ